MNLKEAIFHMGKQNLVGNLIPYTVSFAKQNQNPDISLHSFQLSVLFEYLKVIFFRFLGSRSTEQSWFSPPSSLKLRKTQDILKHIIILFHTTGCINQQYILEHFLHQNKISLDNEGCYSSWVVHCFHCIIDCLYLATVFQLSFLTFDFIFNF